MRSILTAAVIAFTLGGTSIASAQWEHRGGWDHRGGGWEHRGFEGRRFEGERFEGGPRVVTPGRHYGHGRWFGGVWYPWGGTCWARTPIGWVWTCGD